MPRTHRIMRHLWISVAVALIGLPLSLQSQEIKPRVQIIPSVGSYLPMGDLGYGSGPGAENAEAPETLGMSRGLMVGLAVESPLYRTLSVRAGIKYGFGSQLLAANQSFGSCGPNCGMATYDWVPLTNASALLLSTDLVLRPAPATWRLRPYLLGGLGYRRQFYDRETIPAGQAAVQAEGEVSRRVPHLGLGAEWLARSFSIRLGSDIYGSLRDRYNDGFVSLGVSWTP